MAHTRSTGRGGRSRPFALAAAILAGACGGAQEPAPRRGGGEAAPPVDPAGHARHHAGRCDRPRGARGRDAGLQRARGAGPPLPPGLRDGSRDAALPRLPAHRPPTRRGTASTRTPATSARSTRFSRSGSGRPGTTRPPSSPASSSRAASASPGGSSTTTTTSRPGGPSGAPARRPTGPSPGWTGDRRSPGSPGCTTSTRTPPTSRPSPSAARYAKAPYLGEVAAMDEQLGRLVAAFERRAPGPVAIVVASDHGEGLGDHGEAQHGNLVYQSTMHVPLVIVGPGVAPGVSDAPVSARRVFHTDPRLGRARRRAQPPRPRAGDRPRGGDEALPLLRLAAAGDGRRGHGRRRSSPGGWRSYDVVADPSESRDLGEKAPRLAAPAHGPARVPGPLPRGPARLGRAGGGGAAPAGEPRLRLRRVGARRCGRTPRARPT